MPANAISLLSLDKEADVRSVIAVSDERCPACGDAPLVELGVCEPTVELKNAVPDGPLHRVANILRDSRLVRCERCYLVSRLPKLTEADLAEIYLNLPGEYWRYDASKVGSWKEARKVLFKLFSEQQTVRILDVGAFDGSFLMTLPTNWDKFAIEPASVAVAKLNAANISRLAAFVDDLEPTQFNGEFDVVTLFDVFEHLPRPMDTLNKLVARLKPGGRLILSTGNVDHWTWRLVGAEHWYMHSAQHICVGSPRFFRYAAEELQVEIEWVGSHGHQISSLRERFNQFVSTIHWWAKRSERTLVVAMIQRLPFFRHLVHKTAAPFGNGLKDHSLIVLKRKAESTTSLSREESQSCRI